MSDDKITVDSLIRMKAEFDKPRPRKQFHVEQKMLSKLDQLAPNNKLTALEQAIQTANYYDMDLYIDGKKYEKKK